jgi:NADH:ubiquinone oxidoreductase subunit 3 (subunit A)
MGQYAGALSLLAVVVVGIGGLYVVARFTAVASTTLHALPFHSGFVPQEHALSRFHARWYALSVLFLAFDVEMLFMYPWALVVGRVGLSAVVEMSVFLAVLMAGVVWAWRDGALRWA